MSVKFPLLDETGEVQAVCGVSAAVAARNQTDQLAMAEELARIGRWVCDREGR